jgi:hypothetical protein
VTYHDELIRHGFFPPTSMHPRYLVTGERRSLLWTRIQQAAPQDPDVLTIGSSSRTSIDRRNYKDRPIRTSPTVDCDHNVRPSTSVVLSERNTHRAALRCTYELR